MNEEYFEQFDREEQVVEPPHLSIAHAVGLMILLIITQMLIALAFSKLGMKETDWLSIVFTHGVSGILTAGAGAILAGLSLVAIVRPAKFEAPLILPVLFVTAGVTILASELGNVMNWINPISDDYVKLMDDLYSQNKYGVLLGVGLIGPFMEELIFRGVMLDGLQIRYSRVKAAWISSVLFALIHVYPWAMLNALLLGMVFVWLRFQTNTLWPCILAHALYNALPFALSGNISFDIPGFTTMPGDAIQFQPWWFDLAGVLSLGAGVLWIREMKPRTDP